MSQPLSQYMGASNEEEISLKQIAFDLIALLRAGRFVEAGPRAGRFV